MDNGAKEIITLKETFFFHVIIYQQQPNARAVYLYYSKILHKAETSRFIS